MRSSDVGQVEDPVTSKRTAVAFLSVVSLIAVLSGGRSLQAANGYALTDLGTLGGAYSVAVDLDDNGMVAGYSADATEALHAFAWTSSAGMVDLGTLGGAYSIARAV